MNPRRCEAGRDVPASRASGHARNSSRIVIEKAQLDFHPSRSLPLTELPGSCSRVHVAKS